MGVALGPSLGQVYLLNLVNFKGLSFIQPIYRGLPAHGTATKMSGVLWEPSQQPDLVESLSTFANSALTLSLAVPMFLVDVVCCLPSSPRSWRCLVKAGPCCWPQLAWRTPGRATTPSSPFSLSILPPPSSSTDQELGSRTFQN